jgi:hypothetical protein
MSKPLLTKDEAWTLLRMLESHTNLVSTLSWEEHRIEGGTLYQYLDKIEDLEQKIMDYIDKNNFYDK